MNCTTKKRHPGTVSFVRYKLGLSQQQLADTLGVSRSLVAMFETGKRRFPDAVKIIYLEMCNRAADLNPYGGIRIKRGRKPAVAQPIVPESLLVTNYGSPEKEAFGKFLQQKKRDLIYQHTAMQFKKKAAEEKSTELSSQLLYVTTMLDLSRNLLEILPEGRHREKHELRAAFYYAKQLKLKQQLKKWGTPVILQREYQLNRLEMQIAMTDKSLATLIDDQERSMVISALNPGSYRNEDLFTQAVKVDSSYDEGSGIAA